MFHRNKVGNEVHMRDLQKQKLICLGKRLAKSPESQKMRRYSRERIVQTLGFECLPAHPLPGPINTRKESQNSDGHEGLHPRVLGGAHHILHLCSSKSMLNHYFTVERTNILMKIRFGRARDRNMSTATIEKHGNYCLFCLPALRGRNLAKCMEMMGIYEIP